MFQYVLALSCIVLGPLAASNRAEEGARIIQKKYGKTLQLKRAHIRKASHFIENRAPKEMKKGNFYMSKKKTGLKYAVECDKASKNCFIILDSKRAFIGEGACKTVHKAIHYHPKKPKLVARGTQKANRSRELTLTKKMHGKPGLFTTCGFGTNKKKGKKYQTIYSKLYRPGSLHNALEKKTRFSLYEKMKIASDILSGLASLHESGIVHRYLGARNYFIDIPKGKPGKRAINAHIADLGRATYAKYAANNMVQGNTKYTSPEGIMKKNMKGDDYYKSDIFAVGCVLYWVYYGKQAPWHDRSYVKDVDGPAKYRFHLLRSRINHAIKDRRKKLKKIAKPSPKQQFEHLILKMLHTTPKNRSSAKNLSRKMNKIIEESSHN